MKMGFKHTMVQRLQNYEVSPGKVTSPSIPASPAYTMAGPLKPTPPSHITDFSISRILSESNEKVQPAKLVVKKPNTPPVTAIKNRPLTPHHANGADILDLSKNAANTNLNPTHGTLVAPATVPNSLAAYQNSSLPVYPALQPPFATAGNAAKFYAQLFPHMFPSYANAVAAAAAASSCSSSASALTNCGYPKRYFAPYIVNSGGMPPSGGSNNPNCSSNTSNSASNMPGSVGMAIPAIDLMRVRAKTIAPCSRTAECIDCVQEYYRQLPQYKSLLHANTMGSGNLPLQSLFPSYGAGKLPNASYLKAKSSSELLLSSASGTISLTTVTNVKLGEAALPSTATHASYADSVLGKANPTLANSLNAEEISYKCRICEKVFGCSQTLQAHEKTHKSPRYECSDCGKGFSQLRNYKYHLSVHRGTKEFAAECPECGKTFNDKGYLSSHMKIHRNKKEYECPYCPKSFNQRVAFNMHVRIHTGVKPHKCAECGKRFSRKMLLKQHMRTHSGEKPYQCSVCGKSFADRSNMTLHHRLHSGIKPFNCPICPKAFTKKHHLKTHLNYHTGCKPYVCPHPNCNQAFTQSSNMRTHAKKCQYRPLQLQMPAFPGTTADATTTAANYSAGIQMIGVSVASATQSPLATSASVSASSSSFPVRPF